MKFIVFTALIAVTTLSADIKEEIKHLEQSGKKAELAVAYFKDQQQEKAFRVFLEALAQNVNAQANHMEDRYADALKMYLDPNSTPGDTATKILDQYQKLADEHAEWYNLGYLVAVSEANKGQFESFFKRFWNSYSHHSNHFIAFKAQAVLYIKLLEKAKTPDEKSRYRQEIVRFAQKALTLEPKDHSLYRYALAFAADEQKKELLPDYLNKIISNHIITPRTDIKFYVQQAIQFKRFDLAQQYLDKTREWYQYSRAIDEAQNYLNAEKELKS